jgi:3-hydroxybutyryl-CoA dehydratase
MTSPPIRPPVAHIPFEELSVGRTAELVWPVLESEIDAFAALSGDHNPLHVDADFARAKGFPGRVAHGQLLAAKVSAFVGMVMPGRDCLFLESQLAWPKPVHAGDTVTVRGEIVELSAEQRVMRIRIRATKQVDGKAVLVGRGYALCQSRS